MQQERMFVTSGNTGSLFCPNCAQMVQVFYNREKEGKVKCRICGCDIKVKKLNRRTDISVFKPKEIAEIHWEE